MQQLLIDLISKFGITDIPSWAQLLISSLNVIIIIVIALIARKLIGRLLNVVHIRLRSKMTGAEERKRIDTIDRILGYVASVVIGVITVMVVLAELGISIAPFLATAGVVGIAISFGAQSLVKDYFTGFVMLIENQIRQGDFVDVAGKSGNVEEVTLRYVRLRDGEGTVHFVPNSAITTVSNHSRDFAYAVVDVGIGYDANLGQTYEVIKQVGAELRQDPEIKEKILEDIQILGVTALADSAVTVRVRMKVVALEQWGVRRAILASLKQAFEKAGIDIPFPQRVVRITNNSVTTQ
ncbi:mechanosensitive ion channel family protein [Orrella daihaiensis]|uniref:Mechanosensitive ion channel n=1 Tax=Orrella daihaiensis TaxID=2782176 RepID=A0ABY4AGT1_9BURK|nr:mechanosensitive ion channel domain-containing protein [Orrella daihaiensis]UOD49499.1 mechanosensitive ion channel [Orrella daihaiensis]